MDVLVVQGGTPLTGTVRVSGSKNASLPIMSAALMLTGRTVLENVPQLVDVWTMSQLLEVLGVDVQREENGGVTLEVCDQQPVLAPYELVRRMRAGVCVLGPLLAKRGQACVSLPGGCNIGHRPIDLHLKGLSALGAEIEVRNGYVHAQARRLRGAKIDLSGPYGSTVTGTCNVLSAAVLARGTTVIESAAREPEVVALADFLNRAGADIAGQGTSTIVVHGVEQLQACRFEVIPDRIEAATLMIAASISRGEIILENLRIDHLQSVLDLLNGVGVSISSPHVTRKSPADFESPVENVTTLQVKGSGPFRPLQFTTEPYPGIPTDVQAQLMALLCTVPGRSTVRDQIFPDRFIHVAELCRMGAEIQHQQGTATIAGGIPLTGAHVMASDLRASAALVLAALSAEGETVIHRIYHLDRGYERLEDKLSQLGARIRRCSETLIEQLRSVHPASTSERKSA